MRRWQGQIYIIKSIGFHLPLPWPLWKRSPKYKIRLAGADGSITLFGCPGFCRKATLRKLIGKNIPFTSMSPVHRMKIHIERLSVSDKLNRVSIKENILPAINGKTLGDCSEIHHMFRPSFLIFGFPMGLVQFLLEDPPFSGLSIILYSPPLPVPYWYFFLKSLLWSSCNQE